MNERPTRWRSPPAIVAHALEGNELPRRIITRTGFAYHGAIIAPAKDLPGLRVGADGMVHGDEFHLRLPEALFALADWLDEWTGTLRDGSAARIGMLEGETLADWATVLRSLA